MKKDTIAIIDYGINKIFGPISITCCLISDKNLKEIQKKKIKIPLKKEIKDKKIYEIAPKLINMIKQKTILINIEKYNIVYEKWKNKKKILVFSYDKLFKKFCEENNIYDDEFILNKKINFEIVIEKFIEKSKFINILKKQENIDIYKYAIFEKNSNNKYFSAKIAYIIAKWRYLENIKKLSNKYKINIPLKNNISKKKINKIFKNNKSIIKNIIKTNFEKSKKTISN